MSLSDKIDISYRLKEIRDVLGKSRSQLADNLSISSSHLANIENGNRDITVELLILLNSTFNVSINYLLFGTGSMFDEETTEQQVNIFGLNNATKLELLMQLYHYFANTKEIVVDNNEQELLEYLRKADMEIWLEYSKRIGNKVKIIDKTDK